jgi:hypothetical protein
MMMTMAALHTGRVERPIGDIDQETDAVPRADEFTGYHNRTIRITGRPWER